MEPGAGGALGNGVFSLTDASHPVKISQDNRGGLILIISQDEVLQRKLVAYRNCDAETKYADIKKIVNQKYMKHNGFSSVSLAKLFEGLGPLNKTPAQG